MLIYHVPLCHFFPSFQTLTAVNCRHVKPFCIFTHRRRIPHDSWWCVTGCDKAGPDTPGMRAGCRMPSAEHIDGTRSATTLLGDKHMREAVKTNKQKRRWIDSELNKEESCRGRQVVKDIEQFNHNYLSWIIGEKRQIKNSQRERD